MLTARQAAWHMGHPLSQTLFTCLYIERLLWPEPKTIEQAQFSRGTITAPESPLVSQVLRSYCIATVKACYFVHSMITGESYYEVC
jgi:N-alpha-acetyltransferase 35, NatC auxiliary subunit